VELRKAVPALRRHGTEDAMSRTLEGIVGDLMTNSETGEVYSPARVVESRIREAYALGAASASPSSPRRGYE
jgi:poly(3-hydroxybutyrate) depolymerase